MIGAVRWGAEGCGFCPAVAFETGAQFTQGACVSQVPAHTCLLEPGADEMVTGGLDGAAADLES